MCENNISRVKEIRGNIAIMENNRRVRLGPLDGVLQGDYLEIYADIAVAKIETDEALSILSAKKQGGLPI